MFFDEAEVVFISGTGGSGAVAFHTEKHVPRGGPNGADGGRGGSIYLQAERGCRTLYDVRLREKFVAENGIHATGNKRGKSSKDLIVKVPVGTVVTDVALNEVLCDLNVHGTDGVRFYTRAKTVTKHWYDEHSRKKTVDTWEGTVERN